MIQSVPWGVGDLEKGSHSIMLINNFRIANALKLPHDLWCLTISQPNLQLPLFFCWCPWNKFCIFLLLHSLFHDEQSCFCHSDHWCLSRYLQTHHWGQYRETALYGLYPFINICGIGNNRTKRLLKR